MSGDVENYPGFTMISGADLAQKFRLDLLTFEGKGLWVKEGVEVTDLSGSNPKFSVKTGDGSEYHARTVIIASGRIPKLLGVPGEKELFGKGVATCATGSAPFYSNKDVAVVGGGNCALDSAYTLQKIARSVNIINVTDSLKGDVILMKNVTSASNVKVLNESEVVEILGDQAVGGVKVKNNQTGQEQILPVSGVFIEIGWTPSTSFDKLTDKNDEGEIKVDKFGSTSVPGVYACGDVNDSWGEQIVIAAGEGAKTGLKLAEYLSKMPHQATSNIHEG